MGMTVEQKMKAGGIINEYKARAEKEGVVVVVVSEDLKTVFGSFSDKKKTRLVRDQESSVIIYADEDTFKNLNRHARNWIMIFQQDKGHTATYGPWYWSAYDNPARLTDSKGRDAISRDVAGGRAYIFTPMDADSLSQAEKMMKKNFPDLK